MTMIEVGIEKNKKNRKQKNKLRVEYWVYYKKLLKNIVPFEESTQDNIISFNQQKI